jgi:hypothetical protein
MQTFLPYPNFIESAKVLDRLRLGKQRIETLQLLRGQFSNHPASKMWKGYEYQLANYGLAICDEWCRRGYRDTCYDKILIEQKKFQEAGLPFWFGNNHFHRAHRSNLLRKDFKYYGRYFPGESDKLEYIWPV